MKKRVFSLLLCFLLIAVQIPNVFATEVTTYALPEDSVITPLWNYISNINPSLTVNASGVATVYCSVYGKLGTTTRVEIVAELQRYVSGKWVTIKTYTAASDSHRVTLSETYSLTSGYSYRVQATVTAHSATAVESDVVTSGTVELG